MLKLSAKSIKPVDDVLDRQENFDLLESCTTNSNDLTISHPIVTSFSIYFGRHGDGYPSFAIAVSSALAVFCIFVGVPILASLVSIDIPDMNGKAAT